MTARIDYTKPLVFGPHNNPVELIHKTTLEDEIEWITIKTKSTHFHSSGFCSQKYDKSFIASFPSNYPIHGLKNKPEEKLYSWRYRSKITGRWLTWSTQYLNLKNTKKSISLVISPSDFKDIELEIFSLDGTERIPVNDLQNP